MEIRIFDEPEGVRNYPGVSLIARDLNFTALKAVVKPCDSFRLDRGPS
jgi:hypothetical protein